MKNFYYLLLSLALALPFSCSKNGDNSGNNGEVKMEDPATKTAATVIVFPAEKAPEVVVYNEKAAIRKLEFSEASRFIMTYAIATKAEYEDADIVVVGPYTYQGGVYALSGVGTVQVSGNNVTVTPSSGEAQTVAATVTATKTSTVIQSNASRTWKVNSVLVGLSGGKVSIQKSFSGCNLEEIANYAKNNGIPLGDEEIGSFKGAKVNEIILTGANTFVISFGTGDDCFSGTYNISSNKAFSYKLDQGNDILNTDSTGTIDFPSDSRCILSLGTKATHNETEYKGTLEFDLAEVKGTN